MKTRVIIVFIFFVGLWAGLSMRAAYLQVLPNPRLADLQKRQFETVVTLEPRRGDIFDRNGSELAVSVPAYSLFADPKLIAHPKQVAKRLAKLLGKPVDSVYEKIQNRNRRFVWIERRLTNALKNEIAGWKLTGLSFVEESKRVYPNEILAAQVLGFVGQEGRGLDGIEARYDDELRGTARKFNMQRDARGRPLVIQGQIFAERPDGAALELTIDRELQYNLEQALMQAIEEHNAEHATGVILDPRTSEILAMASVPSFNPNQPLSSKDANRRNRAVTDPFEAGSTMKTFAIATGLKAGLLQPNSNYFCENGFFEIGKRTIHEADAKHRFGWLTANEILQHSSNIGASKIALQLGAPLLRETLLQFGFGSRLSSDFMGESRGIMPDLPWGDHQLATISFGHGIATTPLQIANAYATIANGGFLRKPYLVKSMVNPDTAEKKEFEPEVIRRVLTQEESSKLTYMLIGATSDEGTGKRARVPGYHVAGKTGTSQKAEENKRGYKKGAYISSFAGFIPAHDPRFVIYVAVDTPKGTYYGSDVAAPVFSKIASFAIRRAGVVPIAISKNDSSLTDPTALRLPSGGIAFSETEDRNVKGGKAKAEKLQKSSEPVKSDLIKKVIVQIQVADASASPEQSRMPSLIGLSVREVLDRIRGVPVRVELRGQGGGSLSASGLNLVAKTYPAPGETLSENQKVIIQFKRDE